ncbi:MAG: hypothetical protein V3T21_02115, partial [Candidatus Margulisiibacteriota bacterium]
MSEFTFQINGTKVIWNQPLALGKSRKETADILARLLNAGKSIQIGNQIYRDSEKDPGKGKIVDSSEKEVSTQEFQQAVLSALNKFDDRFLHTFFPTYLKDVIKVAGDLKGQVLDLFALVENYKDTPRPSPKVAAVIVFDPKGVDSDQAEEAEKGTNPIDEKGPYARSNDEIGSLRKLFKAHPDLTIRMGKYRSFKNKANGKIVIHEKKNGEYVPSDKNIQQVLQEVFGKENKKPYILHAVLDRLIKDIDLSGKIILNLRRLVVVDVKDAIENEKMELPEAVIKKVTQTKVKAMTVHYTHLEKTGKAEKVADAEKAKKKPGEKAIAPSTPVVTKPPSKPEGYKRITTTKERTVYDWVDKDDDNRIDKDEKNTVIQHVRQDNGQYVKIEGINDDNFIAANNRMRMSDPVETNDELTEEELNYRDKIIAAYAHELRHKGMTFKKAFELYSNSRLADVNFNALSAARKGIETLLPEGVLTADKIKEALNGKVHEKIITSVIEYLEKYSNVSREDIAGFLLCCAVASMTGEYNILGIPKPKDNMPAFNPDKVTKGNLLAWLKTGETKEGEEASESKLASEIKGRKPEEILKMARAAKKRSDEISKEFEAATKELLDFAEETIIETTSG